MFDVPILAGVDLRPLPWAERCDRLELLAQAFDIPLALSPVVEPSTALVEQMLDGRLVGFRVLGPEAFDAVPFQRPRTGEGFGVEPSEECPLRS